MKKRLIKILFYLLVFFILIYNPLTARLLTLIISPIYHLDSNMFYRQIAAESSFRTLAFSSRGAIGLGQVKPQTAKYMSLKYPEILLWFPVTNLMISARYTQHLLKKYKNNRSLALASYNWGETNVDRRIRNLKLETDKDYSYLFADVPETYAFVKKILQGNK